MAKASNETRLAHYAFWNVALPHEILAALAWRRDAPVRSTGCAYLAGTDTSVTVGVASPATLAQLPHYFQRYAPADACPKILVRFASACPDELVVRLRDLFHSEHVSASWYRREGVVRALLDAVLTHPAPPFEPAMPNFEPEDRWRPPSNSYQRRLQRAEAIATYHQMREEPSTQTAQPPPRPAPVLALEGPAIPPLGSEANVAIIPTAPWPDGSA